MSKDRLHALIIEDELLIALDLRDTLTKLGFVSFDFAVSEQQAIELAEHRCPDLITADIELRPGSGIAAIKSICSRHGAVPVVYVTGRPELLHGVSASLVVQKPFTALALQKAYCAAMEAG